MVVLDGKAAIVTGSARGIGRSTAALLSEHGARVLINDLDADVAEQVANEIEGETAVFAGDLTATTMFWGTAWAFVLFALSLWWGTSTFRKENA